jgi:uncharacterized protein (TIGR02284 family)
MRHLMGVKGRKGWDMSQNSEILKTIKDLIETCHDGQNGYRDAAEHVTDPKLKQFFNEQSLQRAQFAAELEQEAQHLGEHDPDRSGSIVGALHRAWFDFKANLGGGDRAILDSVELGEDQAKKAYEDAINSNLSDNLLTIVRCQQASVLAAHDRVRNLREIKAA